MRGVVIAAVAAVGLAMLPSAAMAKKKPEMTPLQLQQMQARDIETPKNTAFAAVMTVLQDSGYRIGSADRDTGLITGTASTNSKLTWMPFVGFGRGKKTPIVSAFIEERGLAVTRVRLNFVMSRSSANQFGGNSDEEPILDPAVYQDAFEKIEQAVFIRQSSDTPPQRANRVTGQRCRLSRLAPGAAKNLLLCRSDVVTSMKGTGFSIVAGATIAVWSFAADAEVAGQRKTTALSLSVEKIASTIEAGSGVGQKGAGLVCLPNGGLYWNRGVAVIDPVRLAETVTDELISQRLPVRPFDRAASLFDLEASSKSAFAVSAEITAARFKICQPRWGLGQPSKVKGTGELDVRWYILSRTTNEIIGPVATRCEAKIGTENDGFAVLVNMILRECSRQFASDEAVTRLLAKSMMPGS